MDNKIVGLTTTNKQENGIKLVTTEFIVEPVKETKRIDTSEKVIKEPKPTVPLRPVLKATASYDWPFIKEQYLRGGVARLGKFGDAMGIPRKTIYNHSSGWMSERTIYRAGLLNEEQRKAQALNIIQTDAFMEALQLLTDRTADMLEDDTLEAKDMKLLSDIMGKVGTIGKTIAEMASATNTLPIEKVEVNIITTDTVQKDRAKAMEDELRKQMGKEITEIADE